MGAGLKVAIAGKGGSGKTTIAGTLARLLGREGYRVLAIDADPAMNLWHSLGIKRELVSGVKPIAEDLELIEERTALASGVFSLTPRVDDIADRYGIEGPDNTVLVIMGGVRSAGSGCTCPANAFIRALTAHLVLRRSEFVVMDMEAGIEHLGRGTVKGMDLLLVVVEPSAQSIETGARIAGLSRDLGVRRILAVGNKVDGDEAERILRGSLDLELVAVIPRDPSIAKADMLGLAPLDHSPGSPAIREIERLRDLLIA